LRAISSIKHWSNWRRLHQSHARRSHYQHRLATDLGHNEVTLPYY